MQEEKAYDCPDQDRHRIRAEHGQTKKRESALEDS
jgi:hypothetical protein